MLVAKVVATTKLATIPTIQPIRVPSSNALFLLIWMMNMIIVAKESNAPSTAKPIPMTISAISGSFREPNDKNPIAMMAIPKMSRPMGPKARKP